MKYIVGLIAMLILFTSGYFFSQWLQLRQAEKNQISSEVILNRIKEVSKLVTVEGYFSEMYNYKNYYNLEWSMFTKKALVRVKAKVSMGVDLNKVNIKLDNVNKVISMDRLPEPEIISLDHDIDYYDITEGTFNTFTPEDFNKINSDAKDYIRKVAIQSELPARAKLQSQKSIETIKLIAESAGWTVKISQPQSIKG
ncbi:MAG: DUF4230 domain-containing protein [Saprospiraceae bacterium]|jgi:hypothetical protein|nr:DUF4230 domain-containing protein [Candidatus Brachybacter algidus]MBK8354810.1 DUF4230 domain-containing protein [Candidatus Brachybacter algidus]MBP7305578.1 DUF4230 domain-containing protein [Saprospiraceae bacterium]MBP9125962.1 DUF4230 domain-containing protein [Saprospiraceae bacterium]HQW70370.1 DUF4230 domain-containing protein [Saprospiraceae bacterium]